MCRARGETPVLTEWADAINPLLSERLSLQVNTHPPATLVIHLIVIVPTLTTVDDQVSHDDIRIQRLTSRVLAGSPRDGEILQAGHHHRPPVFGDQLQVSGPLMSSFLPAIVLTSKTHFTHCYTVTLDPTSQPRSGGETCETRPALWRTRRKRGEEIIFWQTQDYGQCEYTDYWCLFSLHGIFLLVPSTYLQKLKFPGLI